MCHAYMPLHYVPAFWTSVRTQEREEGRRLPILIVPLWPTHLDSRIVEEKEREEEVLCHTCTYRHYLPQTILTTTDLSCGGWLSHAVHATSLSLHISDMSCVWLG